MGFVYKNLRVLPEGRRASRDCAVEGFDTLDGYPCLTPRPAPMMTIWHHAPAQTIHGLGKPRFWRCLKLKLFPHCPYFFRHVTGQKPEDAPCRCFLPFALCQRSSLIEGEGVPRVDLDQVVDEEHFDDVKDIHGGGGVLRQDDSHQCQLPGVLGIILASLTMEDTVASKNRLYFVRFDQELHLL